MCDREEENNNERARVNNMEDSKKVARARNVAESLLNSHLIQTSGQSACADHRLTVIGLASYRHGCRRHIDQLSSLFTSTSTGTAWMKEVKQLRIQSTAEGVISKRYSRR